MHPAAELAFTAQALSTDLLQKVDGNLGLRTCRKVLRREVHRAAPHGDGVVWCGRNTSITKQTSLVQGLKSGELDFARNPNTYCNAQPEWKA